MSKGPAQDPGTLVDAGGKNGFDADCVKALAACNIDPDDFGTYEGQLKRCQNAKAKVEAWKKVDPKDPASLERYEAEMKEKGLGTGPPTASDYRLSKSESAHLTQNAMMMNGKDRHDRCQNIVDGYSQANAPACALHESIHEKQSATEIKLANEAQKDAGLAKGDPRGATLTPEQRADIEKKKVTKMVEDSAKSKTSAAAETSAKKAADAHNQMKGGAGAGAPGDADGAAPGSSTKKGAKATQADIEKAADCIMTKMKQLEKEMKQKCADEADSNAKQAASPEHKAKVADLKDKEQKAKQKLDEVNAKKAAVSDAAKDLNAEKKKVPVDQAAIDAKVAALKQAKTDAGPNVFADAGKAGGEYGAAKKAHQDAASLDCYAQQGGKINDNTNNENGKIPGGPLTPGDPPGVNPHSSVS